MRRDREKRRAALRSQGRQVIQRAQRLDFIGRHVEQNYIRAFQPHFRGRDQQNPHPRGVCKNFGAIENSVVQRDREDAKAQGSCALQQFMRGIVECVLRIIERMDMKVEVDPFVIGHGIQITQIARNI